MIHVADGRGQSTSVTATVGGGEVALVPPHALPGAARRLQPHAPQRLGRHRSRPVRSERACRLLRALHRPTRPRRGVRVRRDLRQRTSQQWLWPRAVAQHHRRGARHAYVAGRDHRPRQFRRAVQPASARRRGDGDGRPAVARSADQWLPGRHVDGHGLRLRRQPGHAARALPRGHRADPQGVGGDGTIRLQRAVHPDALRQRAASPAAAAASSRVDPRRRFRRDVGLLLAERLRVRRALVLRPPDGQGDSRRVLAPGRGQR